MGVMEVVCRTPTSIEFLPFDGELGAPLSVGVESSSLDWSADGSQVLAVTPQGAVLLEAKSSRPLAFFPGTGMQAASLSPMACFVSTWQRPPRQGASGSVVEGAERNLRVWRVSAARELAAKKQEASGEMSLTELLSSCSTEIESAALVLAQPHKAFTRDCWPLVQFSPDDGIAFARVGNGIQLYESASFRAHGRLSIPGVSSFAVSPAGADHSARVLCAFVAEKSGQPAHAAVHSYEEAYERGGEVDGEGKRLAPTTAPALARKSFFRATSARLSWNRQGTAVLVLAASEVDATNQSYYGEQRLYHLGLPSPRAAEGVGEGEGSQVQLCKEGPVHDVQWSPQGNAFAVVAGYMPARTTLHDARGTPKFDLGTGPFSVVRWDPFGAALALAGIGNLPGDLAFYQIKKSLEAKALGRGRAENAVSLEWAPCGTRVLAATTAPRLRVDNGVRVFDARARLLAHRDYPVLLEGAFRPAPAKAYAKTSLAALAAEGVAPAAAGAAQARPVGGPTPAAPSPAPAMAGGYVPPHLRGDPARAAAVRAACTLRAEQDSGGRILAGAAKAGPQAPQPFRPSAAKAARIVPGMAPPPEPAASKPGKSAAKNAKRRAKKAAMAAGGEGDVADGVQALNLEK